MALLLNGCGLSYGYAAPALAYSYAAPALAYAPAIRYAAAPACGLWW